MSGGLSRICLPAWVLALLLLPETAHAHLVQTGFGTFYDGAVHLLLTLGDLLLLTAFALLAGLHGGSAARRVVLVLPLFWTVGILLGQAPLHHLDLTLGTLVFFGVIGGLAALDVRLPVFVLTLLAALCGLLHGYVNGVTLDSPDLLLMTAGIIFAVTILLLLGTALVVACRRHWQRITVRVAGSWLAAVGLLMWGWLVGH